MFLKRRSSNWNKAGEICSNWKMLGFTGLDRLAILDAVWKKEFGRLGEHCEMLGVERGVILVKPRSAAAASELALRSGMLAKSLNKYFKRPWIKAVRTATRI